MGVVRGNVGEWWLLSECPEHNALSRLSNGNSAKYAAKPHQLSQQTGLPTGETWDMGLVWCVVSPGDNTQTNKHRGLHQPPGIRQYCGETLKITRKRTKILVSNAGRPPSLHWAGQENCGKI